MVKTNKTINEQIEQGFEFDDNYKQRITQFLEWEGDRIRKEADQESTCIISRARDEYVQRLSRFLEKEEKSIRKRVERGAENIITKALEERERIFTEARDMVKSKTEEVIYKVKIQVEQTVSMLAHISKQRAVEIADKYRVACIKRADQEAAAIVDSANEQAIQIVAQAKEKAKKQAEEEKREEVRRIVESAKQQSAEIITQAKQSAEKEADKTASTIISLAQQKARQLIIETMETTDKLKNGEEETLTKLISGEQHKSELEATDIFAEAKLEAEQLIKKVVNDTDGHWEIVDEDNRAEDMNEIEPVDEAGGQIKEPGDSDAMPETDKSEENMHASEENNIDIRMEMKEETVNTGSEEMPQPRNEPSLPSSETVQPEQDTLTVVFADVKLEAERLINNVINDTDWRGVGAEKDNKVEDKSKAEFVDEAGGQGEEAKDSDAMPEADKSEEDTHGSEEKKTDIRMEVKEETVNTGSEGKPQPENGVSLPDTEVVQTEQGTQAEVEKLESSDTFDEAKDLLTGETGSDSVTQKGEFLYSGEVEIGLSLSVDKDISAKLYRYLLTTPEIKLLHTRGTSDKGTIITVVLDKPMPLVEKLSLQIPEAQVSGEPSGANGKKRKAKRINITRKEADMNPTEDYRE